MTRFTVPEELLGSISVQGMKTDNYYRITTNRTGHRADALYRLERAAAHEDPKPPKERLLLPAQQLIAPGVAPRRVC